MRILFLSNFFPPLGLGGYEEWCREVALGLRRRGHDVTVLTSRPRTAVQTADPPWVRRELFLEMEIASLRNSINFFTRRRSRERDSLAALRRRLAADRPDHVVIWGMWNMPRSLPALAEELLPERTAYYMGDYWPTLPNQWQNYWQAKPRSPLRALPKLLLKPLAQMLLARETRPPLALERVMFPTRFMGTELARLGFAPKQARIVYGAIDTQPYKRPPGAAAENGTLRLLSVGRLAPEKGVHLAIEAMGELARAGKAGRLTLSIAGAGEPEYENELRELAERNQVSARVELLGPQPKAALPNLYHGAHIFLFTSVWAEPFGRALAEAMAAGLPVIGAPVGGAAELLVPEETALHFAPGDAKDLAAQIERLASQPALRERLARNARELALSRFDSERMTAEIESFLQGSTSAESALESAEAPADLSAAYARGSSHGEARAG